MAKAQIGRHAIFRGKVDGYRVQAIITKVGGQQFEARRRELAAVYENVTGETCPAVSDADVVEFLSRGELETRLYLNGVRK